VVSQVEPGYLAKAVPNIAPEQGEPFSEIADDFQSLIMPGITHWQHPSFFAYFPTPATFEAMLGDLYFASVSNAGFNVCEISYLVAIVLGADNIGLSVGMQSFLHRTREHCHGLVCEALWTQ
jgi:hypothetical protein